MFISNDIFFLFKIKLQKIVTVTLSAGTISGIVVGGMALFIIIGVLIVYYIYQRLLARRFDEKVYNNNYNFVLFEFLLFYFFFPYCNFFIINLHD